MASLDTDLGHATERCGASSRQPESGNRADCIMLIGVNEQESLRAHALQSDRA